MQDVWSRPSKGPGVGRKRTARQPGRAGTEGLRFQTEGGGLLSVDPRPTKVPVSESPRHNHNRPHPLRPTACVPFPSAARWGPGPCSEARPAGLEPRARAPIILSSPGRGQSRGAQAWALTLLLVAVSAFIISISHLALQPAPAPPTPAWPQPQPFLSLAFHTCNWA